MVGREAVGAWGRQVWWGRQAASSHRHRLLTKWAVSLLAFISSLKINPSKVVS